MSYILEALRKSDRARQLVSKHGRGMLYPAVLEQPRSASETLLLGGAGLTAVILAVTIWLWPKVQVHANSHPAATVIVADPTSAAPPLVVQAPRITAAVTPIQAAAAKPVARPSPVKLAIADQPTAQVPTKHLVESGKIAGNGETWQAELPTIVIAGYIRDEQGASLAMINEKLVREGDEVEPNLRLEKILSDGSLFSYKGYQFRR